MTNYRSNGKLLITSEYLVLDGATALALPTKFGQSLSVKPIDASKLIWKSFDHEDKLWFNCEFELKHFFNNSYDQKSDNAGDDIKRRLHQILIEANKLNPMFLNDSYGFEISTQLEFPKNWGLGSSSTLINNIAQWAKVNPYQLLENTFGGSGYDIACASHNNPILYKLNNGEPNICEITFNPAFKSSLYFVHLNKKQNSREGIATYKAKKFNVKKATETANSLTDLITKATMLNEFSTLLDAHENLISGIIDQPTVKDKLFHDFKGSIKSLGAWGGDFVLVASENNPIEYFKLKGFRTIMSYDEMVISYT